MRREPTNQSRALHILEVLEEQRGRPIVDRPRSKCLEVELQSELNVPRTLRAVRVSVDNPEARSDGAARGIKNGSVGDVDKLTSQLDVLMFRDVEHFGEAHIHRMQAGPANCSHTAASERARYRLTIWSRTEPLVAAPKTPWSILFPKDD